VHLVALIVTLIIALLLLSLNGPWIAVPVLIAGAVASCVWPHGKEDQSEPDRTGPCG